MNNKDVIKECRAVAAKSGLTFKRSSLNINNAPAYKFVDRASGRAVLENCTLATAYDNVCSGYIESYDTESGRFRGVNHYA